MIEAEIDVQTADGAMNTFVTRPDGDGPFPLVVFLMDAPGKREELHDMARRIATVGYCVMLPNLYYRRVKDFVMAPDKREEMFGHMNSLTNAMVCQDVQALFDLSAQDAAVSPGPAGCVGYCMSGPFAFAAAAAFGDRIRASASFHGVRLYNDADDSPHLDAHKIGGEMYFGCAETDEWANIWPARASAMRLSGIPVPCTDSYFRNVRACITRPRRSVTGSGCSLCCAVMTFTQGRSRRSFARYAQQTYRRPRPL